MELGNILGKFKPAEKEIPKNFLALVLTDEVVQAAVWHVVEGQTEILAIGTPVEWDGDTGTTAELVTASDATISNAIEGLTGEPDGVILGIPHTWTDKAGILGSKRELIKNICRELELKPLGFVEITDSILSYLKMQEGTPATSILIQVSRDELTLVLVRLGRIEAIETIGRSDDVVEDTTEGIARFKGNDNLPSRIILFNSMHNLDEITQNLLSVDWQTQFNFLHIPKVETLAKDVAIRALAVAGGSEVAKSLGFTVSEIPRKVEETVPSQKNIAEEITEEIEQESPELISAEEIGFSSPTEFAETAGDAIMPVDEEMKTEEIDEEEVPAKKHVPRNFVLPSIHLPRFTLPKPSLPHFSGFSGGKRKIWITALLLVAAIAGMGWFIWTVPKAVVTIQVTPKELEQQVALTLSTTTTSVDVANAIVPATLDTTSNDGTQTINTTGTKIIGDPAKGDLTIYNLTSLTKTFKQGTAVSSGSLKFTLDSDVTVASASSTTDAQFNTTTTPGKNTVAITAAAIGTDSNLPASTQFTIGGLGTDSYAGKNDVALGGGTSQQIQVVSSDDQKNLKKTLTDQLIATVTNTAQAGGNAGTSVYVIPSTAKLTTENYSAKVGDKATTLTGNFTLAISLLRYQTSDVTTLINSLIDQSVPSGYSRSTLPATVDVTADSVSDSGDTVKGNANVKVALLPTIDIKTVQTNLKGKNAGSIGGTLQNMIPGYLSADVTINPRWLPPRFKFLPYNPKNITVTLIPSGQ